MKSQELNCIYKNADTKGKGIYMTQAKIRIIYELLVTQMNHLIFYPFALTIPVLSESLYAVQHPSLLVWMTGGLIPFGYYFCRKYIKSYFLLQILHFTGVGLRVLLAFWFTPKFHIFLFIYFILVGSMEERTVVYSIFCMMVAHWGNISSSVLISEKWEMCGILIQERKQMM